MIKIEKTKTYGWEEAIRGMRNPMNSWSKSDSCFCLDEPSCECNCAINIGENDLSLMKRLIKAGSDHRKFIRFITVTMDITAPLYWWKEYDTYKVGTVANSCSTMHKIHAKEFVLDDFSHEHLQQSWLDSLVMTIQNLNTARLMYLETKDKFYWRQMIQLLPTSFNQKRTVVLNYEVLRNIYKSRRNHKLDEWRDLCDSILKLPYSELIIYELETT